MKKQLILATAVASAGISFSASAGVLSANTWSVYYADEQMLLSANAAALYNSGGSPAYGTVGVPGTGETINVTQLFAALDTSGNSIPNKNLTFNCSGSFTYGDPSTASTLRAIVVIPGFTGAVDKVPGGAGCQFELGDRGQILSGWVRQFQVDFGDKIEGIQIWTPPRRTITWSGASCSTSASQAGPGLTNAEYLSIAQKISDEYDANIAAGTQNPISTPSELDGTGCTPLAITPFSVGYCDPASPFSGVACQTDLAKAVPVPAFAAAALGLGLMGITYLTSRRRKVS